MKRLDFLTAFVLVAGGLAASVTGCELIASVDRSAINGSGGAGTGGAATTTNSVTSTTTTSTGTGGMCAGGAMMCSAPADCPPPSNECVATTCDMGCCGTTNLGNGVATTTQTDKDCQKVVCDGSGMTKLVDDSVDTPADMDGCHTGTCAGTPLAPGQTNKATGTACTQTGGGAGVCGDTTVVAIAGKCIDCNVTADCTSPNICVANLCVAPTCTDMIVNGAETDKDCGGGGANPCPRCNNNLKCLVDSDCLNGNCDATVTPHLCKAATCTDSKKDGTETDVDCGGATCDGLAATCANDKVCAANADCTSTFCNTSLTPKVCKTPSCTDTFQNGGESDVDCGAVCGALKLCANSKKCGGASDCLSGVCDGTNHCNTLGDGQPCTSDTQCTNAHCVGPGGSKICCNAPCAGTCQACTMAFTGMPSGMCLDVTAGHVAPAGQCNNGLLCGDTGNCAAGHVCEEASTSTACVPSTCNGTNQFIGQAKCDGAGMCGTAPAPVSCNTYMCDPTTGCPTMCTNDAGCSTGNFCKAAACIAIPAACMNMAKDGTESDVDCGGGSCPTCASGKLCGSSLDCMSGVCNASNMCN